jgi:hypothetical protein
MQALMQNLQTEKEWSAAAAAGVMKCRQPNQGKEHCQCALAVCPVRDLI